MADHQIQPHRVTKPIQLVAAWLAGLVIIDGMFLAAAKFMDTQIWTHGLLIIAAVVNVPLFLGAIFLLQTKFRAELQEDSFYSEYLSKRTSQIIKIDKNAEQDAKIASLELKISSLEQPANSKVAVTSSDDMQISWKGWLVAVNARHPQSNEIITALESAGIPVETMFGQGKDQVTPELWAIYINRQIPTEFQVRLLKVLIAFDFSGFHRWDPRREAEEFEDVYIGGYGNERLISFNDKLKKILNHPAADELLDEYYRTTFENTH